MCLESIRGTNIFTPGFSGVRFTRSLVFYVVFCRPLLVILSFFFSTIVLSVDLRIPNTPLVSSSFSYRTRSEVIDEPSYMNTYIKKINQSDSITLAIYDN